MNLTGEPILTENALLMIVKGDSLHYVSYRNSSIIKNQLFSTTSEILHLNRVQTGLSAWGITFLTFLSAKVHCSPLTPEVEQAAHMWPARIN
jgi:hypothetical protein